jgi:hypothetical protein
MFFPPHPTSSNLLTGKNATNAPRATLASRGHIDLFGAGLVGAQGMLFSLYILHNDP